VGFKRILSEVKLEVKEDNVSNGAAALAYYLFLAVFPGMIFLLTLVPYLPIANLHQAVMDMLFQSLPEEAAKMFTGVVGEVVSNRKGGLLSIGLLLTLWAASNGMYAIMQQLNITYKVKEERSYIKTRAIAMVLLISFGLFVLGSLGLVIFGGTIKSWVSSWLGEGTLLDIGFSALRWGIIAVGLLLGFASIYYIGPNVKQKFRIISPGSVVAVALLAIASVAFRFYVANFGKYNATYGSIGAVIVMMLWLYITGFTILLGSVVNSVIDKHLGNRHPDNQVSSEGQKPIAA
jgi:membrane protein